MIKQQIAKSAFRIRRAQRTDAPALAALEMECFSEPWSENAIADSMALEYTEFIVSEYVEDTEKLCAKKGTYASGNELTHEERKQGADERETENASGKIVGYISVYISGIEAEIMNVSVSEDFRRRGIALDMLGVLRGILRRERGVEKIFLEVRASNEPAIRLYEKCGFKREGLRKGFYRKPTEDALVMAADITG